MDGTGRDGNEAVHLFRWGRPRQRQSPRVPERRRREAGMQPGAGTARLFSAGGQLLAFWNRISGAAPHMASPFVCASAALGALTPRRCLARWRRARGRCCWWIRFSSTTAQQRRGCGLPPNFARLAPTLRVGLLVPISQSPLAWQPPWDHGIADWHAHLLLSLPQVLKFDHCQLTGVPVVVSKLPNLTCLQVAERLLGPEHRPAAVAHPPLRHVTLGLSQAWPCLCRQLRRRQMSASQSLLPPLALAPQQVCRRCMRVASTRCPPSSTSCPSCRRWLVLSACMCCLPCPSSSAQG